MPAPHGDDRLKPTPRDGRIKRSLLALRYQTLAVALAAKHPRTPWYAKLIALATIAYFLSPIDLLPDPIPLLGQLDDLLIVPLGVWLVVRLTPRDVWQECRQSAATTMSRTRRAAVVVTIAIVVIWIVLVILAVWAAWKLAF